MAREFGRSSQFGLDPRQKPPCSTRSTTRAPVDGLPPEVTHLFAVGSFAAGRYRPHCLGGLERSDTRLGRKRKVRCPLLDVPAAGVPSTAEDTRSPKTQGDGNPSASNLILLHAKFTVVLKEAAV